MFNASHRYGLGLGIALILLGCTVNEIDTRSHESSDPAVQAHIDKDTPETKNDTADGTSDRISTIQERLLPDQTTDPDVTAANLSYRLQVPPYDQFLNEEGYLDLLGRTLDEIDQVLGSSPILVRQSIQGAPIRKEIRVYLPYEEDSTGLYLYFENERVVAFKLDEFNGIIHSGLLDYLK
jgi:hypothetical protein